MIRRRVLVGVVVLTVVLVTTAVVLLTRGDGGPPAQEVSCEAFAATSAYRAAHDVGTGPQVVVIGDSYSVGFGLAKPTDSWPSRLALLPVHVHVAGFSGSGFAEHDSGCGAVSYADRADAAVAGGADVVVVEGGLNDWHASDAAIRAGFDRLMQEVRGHPVVVAGPTRAPARIEETARVDRVLRQLCARRRGVRYVSMLAPDLPYLDDRLHLTQAGHDAFGDRVATAVGAVLATS